MRRKQRWEFCHHSLMASSQENLEKTRKESPSEPLKGRRMALPTL